jgi:hypothetical protein
MKNEAFPSWGYKVIAGFIALLFLSFLFLKAKGHAKAKRGGGQIGSTFEQCIDRYGEISFSNFIPSIVDLKDFKDGSCDLTTDQWVINCLFIDGTLELKEYVGRRIDQSIKVRDIAAAGQMLREEAKGNWIEKETIAMNRDGDLLTVWANDGEKVYAALAWTNYGGKEFIVFSPKGRRYKEDFLNRAATKYKN